MDIFWRDQATLSTRRNYTGVLLQTDKNLKSYGANRNKRLRKQLFLQYNLRIRRHFVFKLCTLESDHVKIEWTLHVYHMFENWSSSNEERSVWRKYLKFSLKIKFEQVLDPLVDKIAFEITYSVLITNISNLECTLEELQSYNFSLYSTFHFFPELRGSQINILLIWKPE